MTYDLPPELEVEVDGPVRVVRLNRPEQLNATNHGLHRGLAELFPQIDADGDARAVVLTGKGRAFSAGGDFTYLDELSRDADRRSETLTHGKQIVAGMVRCRVPIVAAVNGPAVGLGCSLVALSDIVYMAETAHLADPHVLIGLVAADGGPVTWPLLTSLQLAKEYALTGDRIPARRAAEMGLANHVCADDEVVGRGCRLRPPDRPAAPDRRWRTPSASSISTSSGRSWPPWTSPSPPRTGPSPPLSCGPTSTAFSPRPAPVPESRVRLPSGGSRFCSDGYGVLRNDIRCWPMDRGALAGNGRINPMTPTSPMTEHVARG